MRGAIGLGHRFEANQQDIHFKFFYHTLISMKIFLILH